MTLLSRATVLKNREKGVCVYLLEPLTALCSKCSFLSFFPSRALSTPVSCRPAFDYRWKRSAELFSLQRDPVHVFVFPFRQRFIFLFLTKESDVEMQHAKTPKDSKQALPCWPALKHHRCTNWCLRHEVENEIRLLPQFPDGRTNRWFTSLACFYVKFLFPASLSHLYSVMGKLQELNRKSSFRCQPQANRCSEHLQFLFNWSVFFCRERTHLNLKAHRE